MKTTEWFIQKAKTVYGDKYAYTNAKYEGTHSPITVTCPHHGDFATTPNVFIHNKQGCLSCPTSKTQKQLATLHQRNITLVDTDKPIRLHSKLMFRCNTCHRPWRAKLGDVLYGNNGKGTGCIHCYTATKSQYKRLSQQEVNDKIPDKNIKLLSSYQGMNKKHTWECTRCLTQWNATPSKIIYAKTNCPKCFSQNYSHAAVEWIKTIEQQEGITIQCFSNGGEFVLPGTKYKVDGYCKETNTVYEFHGNVYHGNPRMFSSDDKCHPYKPEITAGELYAKTKEREELILSLGYNLVVIWEDEYTKKLKENQQA